MSLKSLTNKGVALATSQQCSNQSKKASSFANSAISSLRNAKSKKDIDQKLNCMIDAMSHLSNSVKCVSDSITPIARMNMISALLPENISDLLNQQKNELVSIIENSKK